MLIDTHCHLTYDGLAERQDQVVRDAHAAGVMRMISVGTDPADQMKVLAAVARFPSVFAALGVHPNHAADVEYGFEGFMEHHVKTNPKVLAIGECGLDYFRDNTPPLTQKGVLRQQLEMARQLEKPVILHVRDAHADALEIMADFPELKFVVHCFTGTPAECSAWLAMGAYIGITGIVTYKNADDVRAACAAVPDDRLLVETDAPFLSPEPVRKVKINQPAHVAHVAAFVANLRGAPPETLAAQTTGNAVRLFGERLLD